MNVDILKIISIIFAALCVTMAVASIIVFFKLKIKNTVIELRELSGHDSAKKKKFKKTNIKYNSNNSITDNLDDEGDGRDETIALVADENTYVDFHIIKKQIYVNTPEKIA